MAETSAIRAGRAFVEIFAEDSQLQRVLARVSVRLTSFGQVLAKIGAGLAGVPQPQSLPWITNGVPTTERCDGSGATCIVTPIPGP